MKVPGGGRPVERERKSPARPPVRWCESHPGLSQPGGSSSTHAALLRAVKSYSYRVSDARCHPRIPWPHVESPPEAAGADVRESRLRRTSNRGQGQARCRPFQGYHAAQGWLSYDYKSADQVHEAARDGERRRETASNAHLRGLAPPSEFSLSQGPGLVLPPARLFLVLWRADAAR